MYLSLNIVCYLHYPICLTLLACLPLWVPQDLVPCHPWNLRTHWCKWRNLCRLKLKFSHRTKSSCSCPVHRTPVMWSGPVCTYILSLSGSVHNINVERLAFKTVVAWGQEGLAFNMANATIRELVLPLMPIISDQPPSPLHLWLLFLVMEIPTNTVIWQKASCCGVFM